ncbi:MAG: hypothetical protein Q9181_002247 [Wetmoreana brouardii]
MVQVNPSQKSVARDEWDRDKAYHDTLLTPKGTGIGGTSDVFAEPLFSVDVARKIQESAAKNMFPQYGLLASREEIYDPAATTDQHGDDDSKKMPNIASDDRIFLNMNVGFSAFVCGSQGSGKSYTLSCMLEAGLLDARLGKLPHPLTGIVFHWDRNAESSGHQPCEAAYLCSSGIPVTVLVSPSNYDAMEAAYGNLKLPAGRPKPVVRPFFLRQKDLNMERMMTLMAVESEKGRSALYIEVSDPTSSGVVQPSRSRDGSKDETKFLQIVRKVLRDIALENRGAPEDIYTEFKERMEDQKFQPDQRSLLNMRLQLLEGFFDRLVEETFGIIMYEGEIPKFPETKNGRKDEQKWKKQQLERRLAQPDVWSAEPGSLTIVDLTDSFVDQSAACTLFDICLSLFLANQPVGRTVIALDEAHKFMSQGESSTAFTESLLSAIRLYRHHGTRVIIATQEPTISPRLLDLCTMNIVHRFTSPDWLLALKAHLAAVSTVGDENLQRNVKEIFQAIVNLETGQALLFSPLAMLDLTEFGPQKLGLRYVKMRVRKRLTADGGRSAQAA